MLHSCFPLYRQMAMVSDAYLDSYNPLLNTCSTKCHLKRCHYKSVHLMICGAHKLYKPILNDLNPSSMAFAARMCSCLLWAENSTQSHSETAQSLRKNSTATGRKVGKPSCLLHYLSFWSSRVTLNCVKNSRKKYFSFSTWKLFIIYFALILLRRIGMNI